jgi:hypothetical protein
MEQFVAISEENDHQDPGPVLGAALENFETRLFH